jgi:hypothetical protein
LLKRALLDVTSRVATQATPAGLQVVSRYSFRGMTFEVFALVGQGQIKVQAARVF